MGKANELATEAICNLMLPILIVVGIRFDVSILIYKLLLFGNCWKDYILY